MTSATEMGPDYWEAIDELRKAEERANQIAVEIRSLDSGRQSRRDELVKSALRQNDPEEGSRLLERISDWSALEEGTEPDVLLAQYRELIKKLKNAMSSASEVATLTKAVNLHEKRIASGIAERYGFRMGLIAGVVLALVASLGVHEFTH